MSSRPVVATDLEFLYRLYRSTRWDETAATGWADEERAAFLDTQFHLQHRYYQEHYADAQFRLLLQVRGPIGRVYWRDRPDAFTLIDISLVPEARGAGIGSAVMAWMTHRADQRSQPCRLHVEPANPARRLYERFGFEVVANNGVHLSMRRTPGLLQAPSSCPRHAYADLARP
ncbi:GNAT family N-acetyltransferase [Schlegelella sp. S2-27]|uniref:GNAT family N-acetyltransferase n=1 Tax=Caldimonas mangrovi TaxID=2944811 RepID=A0ABT0YMY3_9BURK|nr:GNAT family N-acetyltransferase [Caldimonas mangrovi]MCM5680008.1 GNAT family N-acetyltransferase [Caldimonas mangrovi]